MEEWWWWWWWWWRRRRRRRGGERLLAQLASSWTLLEQVVQKHDDPYPSQLTAHSSQMKKGKFSNNNNKEKYTREREGRDGTRRRPETVIGH